jgi:general secretion pathway protein A
MYEKYFGLTERPFSIAPDPRFLYMSQQHREALAHLLYGVGEGGGFVQLTGEVGTGKTTICRCLLEQLPDNVDVALILNPRVTALELLASLCDELRIQYAKDTTSIKVLIDVLNAYLLDTHAKGRRAILMIDEAQNLSAEALEEVRLLTNLETTREKLLQIILIGQPELRELLAREYLRQLSQRINARFHLEPISRAETAAYIRHRLQVCGARESIFNENAVDLVHKLSAGVPRLINVLCDRAMLGTFVEGKRKVDVAIVHRAAVEVLPEEGLDAPKQPVWPWLAATAGLVLVVALAYLFFPFGGRPQTSQLAMEPVDKPPLSEQRRMCRQSLHHRSQWCRQRPKWPLHQSQITRWCR